MNITYVYSLDFEFKGFKGGTIFFKKSASKRSTYKPSLDFNSLGIATQHIPVIK